MGHRNVNRAKIDIRNSRFENLPSLRPGPTRREYIANVKTFKRCNLRLCFYSVILCILSEPPFSTELTKWTE